MSTSILHGRIDSKTKGRLRRRWTDDVKDYMKKTVAECRWTVQDKHE